MVKVLLNSAGEILAIVNNQGEFLAFEIVQGKVDPDPDGRLTKIAREALDQQRKQIEAARTLLNKNQ